MSEETCLLDNHSSFASSKDFHKEAAPPKKRGKVFGKGFLYKKNGPENRSVVVVLWLLPGGGGRED